MILFKSKTLKGFFMLKKIFIPFSIILLLSFTNCGGDSSEEAKELLQKILQLVGIPQEIVVNVCQDNNRDGVCGALEIQTKLTINRDDSIDNIWRKITSNKNGRYFLETYNETLPILLELQDASKVDYDDGKFTLYFDGFKTKKQNEIKEISILQSMIDGDYINQNDVKAIRTLNNQEAQNKFYNMLLSDLEININTLRRRGLGKKETIIANIKEMAEELIENNISKELPNRINACDLDEECIDKELNPISQELIITESEADKIYKSIETEDEPDDNNNEVDNNEENNTTEQNDSDDKNNTVTKANKYDDTKWSMSAVSEGEDNDGEPCEGGSDIWEISNNGQITGSITSGTVDNNNNVFFGNRECQGSLNENGNGSGRCSSADGCIAEWTATLIEGTIG
jgi:hypothetical protein